MEKPSPVELHHILTEQLEQIRWDWQHPLQRRYVYFPSRAITVRGRTWWGTVEHRPDVWGYRPRQARQILAALRPILEEYREEFPHLIQQMIREM